VNVIVIVLDSLRQDHVSLYHQGRGPFPDVPPCQTPHLDAFARSCLVFENAYPEGLPTIPVRCTLMTGQQTLPFRPWQPLTPYDITIAEILREEGYRVLTAADGHQALALIRARAPALVLLDLQMPLLNGWEVLDRLRAEDIRVPVVFLTAAYRARAEAERHDVAGFLAKPFDVDELLAVVARYAAPTDG